MNCVVCGSRSESFGQTAVLGRHTACYEHCVECGFVHVRSPHWLMEAYESAITAVDIGSVWRPGYLSPITKAVIHAFNDPTKVFVDYGAGYGLFVRQMRDLGYDFRWRDKYCTNLFAKGFNAEPPDKLKYHLATAFEVFEHFHDPMAQIAEVFEYSGEVLFTTELISTPPPPLNEWWYYGREHGQHLSFYTEKSLRHIANKFGADYVTDGKSLHLFSRQKVRQSLFRLAVKPRLAEGFNFLYRRPSLLLQDFEAGRAAAFMQQEKEQADGCTR